MKKHIALLILLFGLISYSQEPIILYANPPDRQKIAFDTITGYISLQNSPSINIGPYVKANAGTPLVQEPASTKTLTKEDAWIVYRNRSITSEEFTYTIQNQANGGFTENIGYTFYTKDNGKLFVKGETGSGVEPVEISGAGQYATIIRVGENSWDWSKGVLPWTPVDPNLYRVANALSVPAYEANSITGITDRAEWKASSVSTDPVPYEGNWCMVFTHGGPDNTSYSSTINLTDLEIGTSYTIGMWVYKMNPNTLGISEIYVFTDHWETLVSIANVSASVPQDEWFYYEAIATPKVTNPTIRVSAGSTSDTGHRIAIKNLTIEKISP